MDELFGRNIEQWLGNSDSISLALEFPDTDDHEIDMLLAATSDLFEFQSGLGSTPIPNDETSPSHNLLQHASAETVPIPWPQQPTTCITHTLQQDIQPILPPYTPASQILHPQSTVLPSHANRFAPPKLMKKSSRQDKLEYH